MIRVSHGTHKYDNQPAQLEFEDFKSFADWLNGTRSQAKGGHYICSPMAFGTHSKPDKFPGLGHFRQKELAEPRKFLPFDCDGFSSPEAFKSALKLLNEQGYEYLYYHTSSSTPQDPRVRIIVLQNRETDIQEGFRLGVCVADWLNKSLGSENVKFDKTVWNGYQPNYTPVGSCVFSYKSGQPLDVDCYLDDDNYPPNQNKKPNADIDTDPNALAFEESDIREMLKRIPAENSTDNRRRWRDTLWALAAWNNEETGERLGREWSQTGIYDENEFNTVWRDADPNREDAVRFEYLVKRASYYGWSQSEKRSPTSGASDKCSRTTEPTFNDIYNAERFADKYKGQLLFVHEERAWLQWSNNRWAKCIKGEEIEAAKTVAKALTKEAIEHLQRIPESSDAAFRAAKKSHEAPRLEAMIKLASSDTNLATSARDFDADPYLLGVQNGIVDLRTKALTANEPSNKIRTYCNARLLKGAECRLWMSFLNDLFPDDPATIKSLKLLLGYSLTGLNTEEILIILIGWGANGKSVFSNIVTEILAGYAKTAAGSILKVSGKSDRSPRDDLAHLLGARYVSINETQAGDRLDSQLVKMLAGREPITTRHLYGKFFTFNPTFTPWLRTNHIPIVTDTDDGIWRRLAIIPFRQKFTADRKDPQLEARLLSERDGILGWMIDGANEYLRSGLDLSSTILNESKRYRSESDVLGEFLDEKTVELSGARVEQRNLWNHWRFWVEQIGFSAGTKNSLTRRLNERGFKTYRSNNKTYYCGIQMKLDSQSN